MNLAQEWANKIRMIQPYYISYNRSNFIGTMIVLFKNESLTTKNKVIFIHFNHTNPALQPNSKERNELTLLGYKFAKEGKRFEL